MSIPDGVTTAHVHMDAPVSFTGDPGTLHVTIISSEPLVWAATGTAMANFMDVLTPGAGMEVAVDLPHTDQDGFVDGAGNAYKNWAYTVSITYEKEGELVEFPDRSFQIPSGQTDVNLALIPAGEPATPVIAPIQPVTSLNGRNGAVILAKIDVGLDQVDNTSDINKPVSTAQQAVFDAKQAAIDGKITRPAAPGADRILFWDDSAGAYVPLVHAAPLDITGTALTVTPATGAAAGSMSAADKAKLDAATSAPTASTLVSRDGSGNVTHNQAVISAAGPTDPSHAARKDYVDAKVGAVTYASLGIVPTSSLPPLAINETFPVADQASMLALTAQRGDMAIRSDNGRTYVLSADTPTVLSAWKEIMAAGQVQSVAGKTGVVSLVKADVGLDQVDNTSDINKPVSAAGQTALNAKQSTSAKGAANGYAPLDANSRVPAANVALLSGTKANRDALTGVPVGMTFLRTDRDNHVQTYTGNTAVSASGWEYKGAPERIQYAGTYVQTANTGTSSQVSQLLLTARTYATRVRPKGALSMLCAALTSPATRNVRHSISVGATTSASAQARALLIWLAPGSYYLSALADTNDWVPVAASVQIDVRQWIDTIAGTAGVNVTNGGFNENWLLVDILPADD